MTKQYRFILAPYKPGSKITCPQCGQRGKLRRYLDRKTGDYLPPHVGICDREQKCGYKYTWWDWKEDNNIDIKDYKLSSTTHIEPEPDKYTIVPPVLLERSLSSYKKHKDELSDFLIARFGSKARSVLAQYKVGYALAWDDKNCTVFWQIDVDGGIRSGKIMAYEHKGRDIKRVKSGGRALINWVHSYYTFKEEFLLRQCFFGEHLLRYYDLPVCIVEGEKTAIICAILFPEYIWMAAGSMHGINDHKMQPLKEHKIILIPDKGSKPFEVWDKKREQYAEQGYDIEIKKLTSDELQDGDDLADLLF